MKPSKNLSIVIISASVFLSGCQTQGQNQLLGTGAGAIIGGFLGSQVGEGTGQTIATIVGAAAGAWIGSEIARYLSEPDQQSLAQSTQSTAMTGQPYAWSNPQTGVRGETRVKQTQRRSKQAPIKVLKGKIQTAPPLEIVQAPYESTKKINVRGGPGTDYVVVDRLSSGEKTTVLGRVIGKPWVLIADNGVGRGYVHETLLRPSRTPIPAKTQPAAATEDIVEIQVNTGQTCRVVTQQVHLANGSQQTDDITVCNGPDGWQLV